ncbi:HlyD family efflux transporter periplasmic adaptor subunit [Leptolyngbyaceae cyanobacterium CCMR0082]|uniref:HlyD family efflux transporter periplasmic adaptor subunit n=2 Tax=Adonisia turfae TaxID=2950184 RepID=A0A6M0S917_9CYAN|nr:HlyD family efflux transporter periplasmic adaptor subunit [Adonisia turfae]MDV3347420.1 HlyD family efflux transporter periplasmic adaptor subunit [Leptothoe sp. LEGE 181152]NEZ57453.1 HlyD family efflux transporter periplasmic adaptor subunit [Adonisia turfae CCMR0081]NEZ64919.1 HlyD family efflux transporter periplasmic adaptor subunit [Adonisia turfae CCMR0082]
MQRRYKLAIACITLAMIALAVHRHLFPKASEPVQSLPEVPEINANKPETVVALGRVIPKSGVISLSGPSQLFGARIAEVNVQEGDEVTAGQIIALLDTFYSQQAELAMAEQRVSVAKARLDKVLAGEAKLGDIAAQEAEIANLEAQLRAEVIEKKALIERMQAELQNAEKAYQRFQVLYEDGAISISDLDDKQEQFEVAQAQLNEVKAQLENIQSSRTQQIRRESATLERLEEVRPVDIAVVQAELKAATAAAVTAASNLELTRIRAPVAGRILKIHTLPGEQMGQNGIVDLGQTQEMYILAEVYETDIAKIQAGQAAIVKLSALSDELQGTVEKISHQIGQKEVFDNDPALEIDARVFEVEIRLNPSDSEKVTQFIHMEADVTIQITSSVQ